MKEFENWWLMEAQNIVGVGRATEKDITKESWKVALGWVQSRLKFGSEVAYSEADILMAIKKEINEELNNE